MSVCQSTKYPPLATSAIIASTNRYYGYLGTVAPAASARATIDGILKHYLVLYNMPTKYAVGTRITNKKNKYELVIHIFQK